MAPDPFERIAVLERDLQVLGGTLWKLDAAMKRQAAATAAVITAVREILTLTGLAETIDLTELEQLRDEIHAAEDGN